MLKMWDSWIETIEVSVKSKLCQALPWRLVRLDFNRVHSQRRIVSNGRRRHHRDPVKTSVAQFPAVLLRESENNYFALVRTLHPRGQDSDDSAFKFNNLFSTLKCSAVAKSCTCQLNNILLSLWSLGLY